MTTQHRRAPMAGGSAAAREAFALRLLRAGEPVEGAVALLIVAFGVRQRTAERHIAAAQAGRRRLAGAATPQVQST